VRGRLGIRSWLCPSRASSVFRPDVLPADVEARRAVTALQAASRPEDQRAIIAKVRQLTPDIIALRDIGAVAEVVAGLDRSLGKIQDPEIQEAIGGGGGGALRMRLLWSVWWRASASRACPLPSAAHLVNAVGALGAVSAGSVVDAYLHAAPELREAYRAAMRAAGERAVELLQARVESKVPKWSPRRRNSSG